MILSDFPPEWRPGAEALRRLPEGRVALLVAGTDRGKTTFATMAARLLAADGMATALVDADIGQGEIGPPGTVGVAMARAEAARLSEWKPAGVFFVGAFAPNTAALELVAATAQAVGVARERGAARILVDTTGFVSGPSARRLKVAKAQALRPALILALGGPEEDSLVQAVAASCGAEVVRLATPDAVGRKPTALRSTRRMTRLATALDGAAEIALPLEQIATVGATLGTGQAIAPELARWSSQTLRLPVLYGEIAEGTVSLLLERPATGNWESSLGIVITQFGARNVRLLSLPHYIGAYLGLYEDTGRLLGVGLFRGLDVERREVRVHTLSTIRPAQVALLAFGRVRLTEDLRTHTEIRPGEL